VQPTSLQLIQASRVCLYSNEFWSVNTQQQVVRYCNKCETWGKSKLSLLLSAVVPSTYIIINICCSFEMTRRQDPCSFGAGIRLFAPHAYSVSEHTTAYKLSGMYSPGSNGIEARHSCIRNVWDLSSISPHVFIARRLNMAYKNENKLLTLLLITTWFKLHFPLFSSEY
jgi:hypothetical protein